MRVAQTNLQLIAQMKEAGYSPRELQLVGEAYNLAARAYVNKYRATGKPLIAHVVGTASLLLYAGCRAETLAAGILHAAPPDGDFGLRRWRSVAKARVGADVAALVDAYEALNWVYTVDQVDHLLANVDRLTFVDREAAIIRLANEIEDYVDDAITHYGFVGNPEIKKSAAYRRQYFLKTSPAMRALATKLDAPLLADCIEETRLSLEADLVDTAWPRLNQRSTAMFVITPASYRLRPLVRLARTPRLLRRMRNKGVRGTGAALLRRFRA